MGTHSKSQDSLVGATVSPGLEKVSGDEFIVNEISFLVSAEQGKGVNTAGDIFGSAAASMGLYVFQNIEYHSNIMGRNSYTRIVISEQPIHSHYDLNDIAVLLGGDAMTHVLDKVRPGGAVLYNTENTTKHFESERMVEEAIDKIKNGDIQAYGIPASTLIRNLSDSSHIKPALLAKMTNTAILGATYAVLGANFDMVHKVIETTFKKKPKVIPLNKEAAKLGFDYIRNNFDQKFNMRIQDISGDVDKNEHRLLMRGTNSIALGAINAGMQFYIYYPITPASDTGDLLDHWKEKAKIMVEQAEDEIAAINGAIGAGRTGVRAMTGTSGPGFDLKTEAIGMAIMTEDPVVIMLAQRPGPSTGLPTRGDQSDLLLALYACHGGAERIVLIPGDVPEAFYMVQDAFNLADKYQMPVIFLTDKHLMNSTETIAPYDLDRIPIDRGSILTYKDFNSNGSKNRDYKRYEITDNGISPRSLPGIPGGEYNSTTDEHTEYGIITDDADNRIQFNEKRFKKMQEMALRLPEKDRVAVFGDLDADISLIGWGSTKGPILDSMRCMKKKGYKIQFLQIKYASPFPSKFVKNYIEKAELTIIIEENRMSVALDDGTYGKRGQMEQYIRSMTGMSIDKRILKENTRPFSKDEICDCMMKIISEKNLDTIFGGRV